MKKKQSWIFKSFSTATNTAATATNAAATTSATSKHGSLINA